MTKFVRVRDKTTGHQYTTTAVRAAQNPNLQVVDRPATNVSGHPLPPKYRVKAAASKPASDETTPPEENK